MKTKSLLLVVAISAGALLTGCKNNTQNGQIRKPIFDNLIGSWAHEASYILEDGEWVEDEIGDIAGFSVDFRADSTVRWLVTNPDYRTFMYTNRWSADDETEILSLNNNDTKMLLLTEDTFEHGDTIAMDTEIGDYVYGDFKWTMKRFDRTELNLAEKLLGKWSVVSTYEKVDGEWQETSFGMPDEGTQNYREDGTVDYYTRVGDLVNAYSMNWSINIKTGELFWTADGSNINVTTIEFLSNDTLACYYTTNYDVRAEETKQGEFRDVFVRE